MTRNNRRVIRQLRSSMLLAVCIGLLGYLVASSPAGWALEENLGLSWLFQLRGPRPAPPNVAIVALDRQSANALEQSRHSNTWPRVLHAELINKLVAAGAAVVIFDMYFETHKDDDATLAQAIATAQRVLLFERAERLVNAAGATVTLNKPVEILRTAASGSGPFPLPKIPVQVNRFWAFFNDTPTLPVVALQLLALQDPAQAAVQEQADLSAYPEHATHAITDSATQLRSLMDAWRRQLQDQPDRTARLLEGATPTAAMNLQPLLQAYTGPDYYYLNFYGPPATISMLPYSRFFSDEPLPDLQGKTVFIGDMDPTHFEQPDQFLTVFSTADGIDLSGVEILATAFANLSTDTTLRFPDNTGRLALLLGYGVLLSVVVSLCRHVWLTISAILMLGTVYLALAQWLFAHYYVWLPLATPLLVQIPLVILLGLYWNYAIFRRVLRRYVPAHATDIAADRPSDPVASYGVCLSSDVTDYTTLSERLLPQDLVKLSNEYFDELGKCIEQHGGQMLEIAGDGMTCTWPSPQPDSKACQQACLAALEIQEIVARFNARHPDYPFPTRIGLHAGWLALGHMGGGGHYIYGVAGDVPNTASRIEGLNKYLGTTLLAEQSVTKDLSGILLRRLGQFQPKGKRRVLNLFELVGLHSALSPAERDWYASFDAAFVLYEAGRWEQASNAFQALLQERPTDGPSRFFWQRCQACLTDATPASGSLIIHLAEK
ncbi:MAG: adenylate/guanylate cyclase domain-containing protein [Candidatus Competibacteraceae bacterium]|nr:adenylate/guanylate cyclase domain-containing protein [Candidatus Competibacteraceae bacterium]MCB1803620.1 adenylate/guanylate cyclase domain-containing protein [Candidatus Competibacteraceae bacterium]MCB1815443.1 adenylate/guanylate cyclase domain-containing protein [Candidatus Competibacteraceae bacterium]